MSIQTRLARLERKAQPVDRGAMIQTHECGIVRFIPPRSEMLVPRMRTCPACGEQYIRYGEPELDCWCKTH